MASPVEHKDPARSYSTTSLINFKIWYFQLPSTTEKRRLPSGCSYRWVQCTALCLTAHKPNAQNKADADRACMCPCKIWFQACEVNCWNKHQPHLPMSNPWQICSTSFSISSLLLFCFTQHAGKNANQVIPNLGSLEVCLPLLKTLEHFTRRIKPFLLGK